MGVTLIVALGTGLLSTPLAGLLGARLGLLDQPNELSIHRRPVPRVGGLAIALYGQ